MASVRLGDACCSRPPGLDREVSGPVPAAGLFLFPGTCARAARAQIHRTADVEPVGSCQGSLNVMVQLVKALCSGVILYLQYVFPLSWSANVTFTLCIGWV